MKVLLTGASGFLGQAITSEAVRRHHHVRALVRPTSDVPTVLAEGGQNVEVVRAELRDHGALREVVRGVDAVIHAASAMHGSLEQQMAGTVTATEELLSALSACKVLRFVLVGSFSVYDYLGLPTGACLAEESPLEPHPERRHPYCQTKLAQDRLVRRAGDEQGLEWTILRSGPIIGAGRTLVSRLGQRIGGAWLRIGAHARVPLTYVENCADAVVSAAENDAAVGQVLNVVDDELPTQAEYLKALQELTGGPSKVIPIPWTLWRTGARLAWWVGGLVPGGRRRLPTLLVPASAHANSKPLRYSNEKLKRTLGWAPHVAFDEALRRSVEATRA